MEHEYITSVIAGNHDPNTPLVRVDVETRRAIVQLMASGEIEKQQGLQMLKADYLCFSFLGIMQLYSIKANNPTVYYGQEISKWFDQIKARNKNNNNQNTNEL